MVLLDASIIEKARKFRLSSKSDRITTGYRQLAVGNGFTTVEFLFVVFRSETLRYVSNITPITTQNID